MKIKLLIIVLSLASIKCSIWDNYFSHMEADIKVIPSKNQIISFFLFPKKENNTNSVYTNNSEIDNSGSNSDSDSDKTDIQNSDNFKTDVNNNLLYHKKIDKAYILNNRLFNIAYSTLANIIKINTYRAINPEFYLDNLSNYYNNTNHSLIDTTTENNSTSHEESEEYLLTKTRNQPVSSLQFDINKENAIIDIFNTNIVNSLDSCYYSAVSLFSSINSIKLLIENFDLFSYYNQLNEKYFELVFNNPEVQVLSGKYTSEDSKTRKNSSFIVSLIKISNDLGATTVDEEYIQSIIDNYESEKVKFSFLFKITDIVSGEYDILKMKLIYDGYELLQLGVDAEPKTWFGIFHYFNSNKYRK